MKTRSICIFQVPNRKLIRGDFHKSTECNRKPSYMRHLTVPLQCTARNTGKSNHYRFQDSTLCVDIGITSLFTWCSFLTILTGFYKTRSLNVFICAFLYLCYRRYKQKRKIWFNVNKHFAYTKRTMLMNLNVIF